MAYYVSSGQVSSGIILNDDWMNVYGSAVSTTLNSQGCLYVYNGGTATHTTVNGGDIWVFDGGTAADTTVDSSGYAIVSGAGSLRNTIVNGGYLLVSSGGTAADTTAASSGQVFVSSAGSLCNTVVNSGASVFVDSGGTHTGSLNISGGYFYVDSGGVVDFDISGKTPGSDVLISDLSRISGYPSFTVTMSSSQTEGQYQLAAGTSSFSGSISVTTELGDVLGTVSIGSNLTVGSLVYSLIVDSGILTFQIGTEADAPVQDTLLPYTLPQAEYMYGCVATATGMLLGYYDLYGYTVNDRIYDFSNLIDGTISVDSRGSDGGSIYDMSDPSVLANFIASTGYVSRFYDQTPEHELPYSYVNGDPDQGLNVSVWDCLADYLGTGQYWRGNGDLSTSFYYASLDYMLSNDFTYPVQSGFEIPGRDHDFKYGLYLFAQERGYLLDTEATRSVNIEDFSFNQLKAEIDAGRPVLLSMQAPGGYGHMVIAYGYNSETQEVIFDDTYRSGCRMVWNGTYNYGGNNYSLSAASLIVFEQPASPPVPITYLVETYSGGELVSAADVMTGKTLVYGGTEDLMLISSGGTANSTTVSSGGSMIVSGMANSTTVNSGGSMDVSSGGTATSTTVNGGFGLMYAWSGGTAANTMVNGGRLIVTSGGTANSTTVVSAGKMYVVDGGTATYTTVNNRGNMYVSSGGTANSTTVNSGGSLRVDSGGSATNIIWTPCVGYVNVADGGYAAFVSNYSGVYYGSNNQLLSHAITMDGKTVTDRMYIMSDGTTADTTVELNGGMYVSSGGTANSTTVNAVGGMYVSSGGTANSTTVNNRGNMYVCSGGTATNTTVNSGRLNISSSGTATDIVWTPCIGYVTVADGGYATFTSSYSGVYYGSNNQLLSHAITMDGKTVTDSMYVMSNGMANTTTVNSYGYLYVWDGGAAENTTVNSGGLNISSGGTATNTTINAGGNLYVYRGGMATGTTVKSGGRLYVSSGGTATNINWTPCIGHVSVEDGGNADFVSSYSGVYYGSADQLLSSAAVMVGKTVTGSMYVFSGGTAKTAVIVGGILYVSSGGTATDTTVNSYTTLFVYSEGIAKNTSVNFGGRLSISSGGKHAGTLQVEKGATVSAYEGSIIDFAVAGRTSEDDYLINDLSLISGTPTYTITVAGDEAAGSYKLAQGASSFTGTISIGTDGSNYGSLTVNEEALTVNSITYLLRQEDGNLTLEITDFAAPMLQIIASTTDPTNQPVILTATATDNVGVASVEYSWNGTVWNAYSDGVSVDSNRTVYFRATDTSGNVTDPAVSYTVTNIDTTAPVITLVGNNSAPVQSATLTASADDGSAIYYSTDNTNWTAYTAPLNVTANATYYFKATDAARNTGTNSIVFGNIDRIAPTAPAVSADITAPTNQDVTVSAVFSNDTATKQYSLDNRTWNPYTAGVVMSANGTVYFRGIDEAGNVSDVTSYTVSNIDKVAPEAPAVSADITTPTNQDVTVSAVFSNDTATKQYSLDNQTWNPYTAGVVMSANGTVYFRGIDAAGNISEVISYAVTNIDKTATDAPIVSASTTAVTNQNVVLTATYSEDTATKQYSTDNQTWQPYTGSVMVNANGKYYFRGIDDAGNISAVKEYNVTNIDKIAPVKPTAGADITTPTNGNVTVTATFSDDSAQKQYSLNGQNFLAYDNGVVMQNNGTVYFLGIDEAGNASEVTSYVVSNIDKIAPVKPTASADITTPTNGNVTVTATFSDDSAQKQYSLNGEDFLAYDNGVVIQDNGTVYFRGIDEAGNASEVTSYVVSNIDKIAPVKPTASADITTPTNGNVTVTATFSDDSAQKQYSLNGEDFLAYDNGVVMQDNGTVYFRGIDEAGNASDVTSYTVGNICAALPVNPEGSASGLRWTTQENSTYAVEYSTDQFGHAAMLTAESTGLDVWGLPQGTYQWRVRAAGSDLWVRGDDINAASAVAEPRLHQSAANGYDDVFFARADGRWDSHYAAEHIGTADGWATGEQVSLKDKNRIADIFEGSDDANVLLLTDDAKGDALFIDDIYTALPGTVSEQRARIARIDEIRAGAGDDIVDLTSPRFEYEGSGLTIRGGAGNDTIWANGGDNFLFGDAGNDRLVGASGDDVLAGGIGNDSMHGGGGNDIFTFCENWGNDTVEQLADGEITLWFASGDISKWDADSLTYADGENSVMVSGITADQVTLIFGDDGSEQYETLSASGAFAEATSEKIFEDKAKGLLA